MLFFIEKYKVDICKFLNLMWKLFNNCIWIIVKVKKNLQKLKVIFKEIKIVIQYLQNNRVI